MSTKENYLQLWVIQEWEKENQALLRKKNYQKSRPKIMSADVDQLQWEWSLEFDQLSLIVRLNVVMNKTVVVDSKWRFDNLCSSHL